MKNFLYPKQYKLQEGGKYENPRELTSVSDGGEHRKPTHLQLEI
jgi:hypothetical protein